MPERISQTWSQIKSHRESQSEAHRLIECCIHQARVRHTHKARLSSAYIRPEWVSQTRPEQSHIHNEAHKYDLSIGGGDHRLRNAHNKAFFVCFPYSQETQEEWGPDIVQLRPMDNVRVRSLTLNEFPEAWCWKVPGRGIERTYNFKWFYWSRTWGRNGLKKKKTNLGRCFFKKPFLPHVWDSVFFQTTKMISSLQTPSWHFSAPVF